LFGLLGFAKQYLIPILLTNIIAALAYMIGYGFQAVCVQIKVDADYSLEQYADKK
jgi:hypothetical protein